MTKKMKKQIENMIRDQIIKRNPQMKGLVKVIFWGITEGFSLEDAHDAIALIDYSIYIRQRKNQPYHGAFEDWDRDYVRDLMYFSFGTPTLAIQIKDKKISVG